MQGYRIAEYLDDQTGRKIIMGKLEKKTNCGRIRRWLSEAVANQLESTAAWTQRHIANCPRCRRLALGNSRIRLALLLIKTQPHSLDLLAGANSRAIGVLTRSLRELPKAEKLRHICPEPSLPQRLGKYTQALGHAAACLAVLLMLRMGIFSSLKKVDRQGREVVKQYYSRAMDAHFLDDVI